MERVRELAVYLRRARSNPDLAFRPGEASGGTRADGEEAWRRGPDASLVRRTSEKLRHLATVQEPGNAPPGRVH